MGAKTSIIITVVGLVIGVPMQYVIERLLVKWGILDDFSDALGDYLKLHVSPVDAALAVSLLITLSAYGGLMWLVWHKKKTGLESVALSVSPVTPPPADNIPENNDYGVMPPPDKAEPPQSQPWPPVGQGVRKDDGPNWVIIEAGAKIRLATVLSVEEKIEELWPKLQHAALKFNADMGPGREGHWHGLQTKFKTAISELEKVASDVGKTAVAIKPVRYEQNHEMSAPGDTDMKDLEKRQDYRRYYDMGREAQKLINELKHSLNETIKEATEHILEQS